MRFAFVCETRLGVWRSLKLAATFLSGRFPFRAQQVFRTFVDLEADEMLFLL